MLPLSSPYMLVAAGVAAVLIAAGAYYKGREAGLEKLHEYKAEVAEANAIVAAENATAVREAEERNRALAADYADASRKLRDDYNSRLRKARRDCAATASLTASASGVDGGPTDTGLAEAASASAGYEDTCARLEADCAVTTLRFVWLREWVTEVCK